MGLAVANEAQYHEAVRRLFPQGEYWDAQFADAQSDASLFVRAKAAELLRFRKRMLALIAESKSETTTELIADWERGLLDETFPNLDINQRRMQLKSKSDLKLNRAELERIAGMFGLHIKAVCLPYRPHFFGFAKFAQDRLGSFTALSGTHYCAA